MLDKIFVWLRYVRWQSPDPAVDPPALCPRYPAGQAG